MNDIRRYINILENALKNASNNELQKYRDERAKYWPVPAELMAQYKDGSHSNTNSYGGLEWKQNGKLHRNGDKPAVITADGGLVWSQNGQTHRDGDKPAFINSDGTLSWWKNGKLHRDGDKPAIIGANGSLLWYQNNKPHRFGGPARIYQNGKLEWYWRGEEIPVKSQEEFIKYLKKHKGLQQFRVNKS